MKRVGEALAEVRCRIDYADRTGAGDDAMAGVHVDSLRALLGALESLADARLAVDAAHESVEATVLLVRFLDATEEARRWNACATDLSDEVDRLRAVVAMAAEVSARRAEFDRARHAGMTARLTAGEAPAARGDPQPPPGASSAWSAGWRRGWDEVDVLVELNALRSARRTG